MTNGTCEIHFFSFYSATIHVSDDILSGIIHFVRPLFKPQMLHTDSYTAVLINCWARAIKNSLLFCRVVHASCDCTSCKFFYFYNLVLWISRTCVCQDTIKHFSQFCIISQIQVKSKTFFFFLTLSQDKTAYRRREEGESGKKKKQCAQLKRDASFSVLSSCLIYRDDSENIVIIFM